MLKLDALRGDDDGDNPPDLFIPTSPPRSALVRPGQPLTDDDMRITRLASGHLRLENQGYRHLLDPSVPRPSSPARRMPRASHLPLRFHERPHPVPGLPEAELSGESWLLETDRTRAPALQALGASVSVHYLRRPALKVVLTPLGEAVEVQWWRGRRERSPDLVSWLAPGAPRWLQQELAQRPRELQPALGQIGRVLRHGRPLGATDAAAAGRRMLRGELPHAGHRARRWWDSLAAQTRSRASSADHLQLPPDREALLDLAACLRLLAPHSAAHEATRSLYRSAFTTE